MSPRFQACLGLLLVGLMAVVPGLVDAEEKDGFIVLAEGAGDGIASTGDAAPHGEWDALAEAMQADRERIATLESRLAELERGKEPAAEAQGDAADQLKAADEAEAKAQAALEGRRRPECPAPPAFWRRMPTQECYHAPQGRRVDGTQPRPHCP